MIKPTSLLTLTAALVLGSMTAATIGCAAPPIQSFEQDDDEDTDESEVKEKKKDKKSNSSSSSSSGGTNNTTPPPANTTPPPANTTPPPTTPPPGGDPEACFDQCAATGPAAQYWSCSASCQDQACDDNCWNQSCGQNEQACDASLSQCDQQCFGGQDPNAP